MARKKINTLETKLDCMKILLRLKVMSVVYTKTRVDCTYVVAAPLLRAFIIR